MHPAFLPSRSGPSTSSGKPKQPKTVPLPVPTQNKPRAQPPQRRDSHDCGLGRKIIEDLPAHYAALTAAAPRAPVFVPPPPPPPRQTKWANPGQQDAWMTPLPLPPRRNRPAMPPRASQDVCK
ncbi:hypothetical protein C8R46DRAFT_1207297 [Mycena filopes]|nr:hypothetical protein C8R46DRAFT_1207297 [Mycena filopes]